MFINLFKNKMKKNVCCFQLHSKAMAPIWQYERLQLRSLPWLGKHRPLFPVVLHGLSSQHHQRVWAQSVWWAPLDPVTFQNLPTHRWAKIHACTVCLTILIASNSGWLNGFYTEAVCGNKMSKKSQFQSQLWDCSLTVYDSLPWKCPLALA